MHKFIRVFFTSSFDNIHKGPSNVFLAVLFTKLFFFTMQGFSSLPDLTCNHGDDSLKQKALVLNFNGSDLNDNWILSDIGKKVFNNYKIQGLQNIVFRLSLSPPFC